ncbi:MAG: right-handed parallel beta-helix repeat-containing protein [Acidobacteria bacterium]|nr:right-handed parallel beta-helix repeat-containing protein [Acidobacteriota bacterium]
MRPLLCGLALAVRLSAQDATIAGAATSPYPTVTNLSVEWRIEGDANGNGHVAVQYRRAGETAWSEGLPLRRIRAGNSGKRSPTTFYWDNRHSGSIFDLRPDSEYEIRLILTDPDGGAAERTLRARTRAVPRPASDARTIPVNPRTFRAIEAAAQPGDILLLSPGFYQNAVLTRDGAPGRPIVIRGDTMPPIGTTFDSILVRNRKHLILEKLAVDGPIDLAEAEDVAVRYCRVNARFGIIANRKPGARNCYIADNIVASTMPWIAEAMGSESIYRGPASVGEGIQMTGPGNVICHNRVKGYRDCISTMEDAEAFEQVSIDIYNNDIEVGDDDAIEADFCMGNCRILRNRITNCFMGLSSQPSLGGPAYFIRNVMYNIIEAPFKLERGSGGNLFLHNTVVKVGDGLRIPHGPGEYSDTVLRNNLVIGGAGAGRYGRYTSGTGRAFYTPETDASNDFDYDGVGTFGTPFAGSLGKILFSGIEELRRLTTEKHAVRVDIGVFDGAEFPNPPFPERRPPELRLRRGSAAVDAGVRLPNVNDGFRGVAPDLGAHERERPLPHYGPRPEGTDEGTIWEVQHRDTRK